MAPVQNKTNSSTASSSSSHDTSPRRGREFPSDTWESFLPVSRRGRFFQDSFFENTRSHFDDAVREALSRWDDDSDFLSESWHDAGSPLLSNFSRYRQMRNRHVDDDSLAVTVTSDNNVHKIVLDVHDFVEGDLKVKVVGDRELLVEGRREKAQEGASATSSQKFSRRFALPEGTDIGAIDSVMSSDGILTITAPKLGRAGATSSHSETKTFSSSASKARLGEREPCECDKCNPKLRSRENVCRGSSERSQSRFSSDGSRETSEHRQNQSECTRMADRMDVPINAFFNSRPITRRGRFFDDSFFEDTRSGYRTAIQDILSKWGERSSSIDDMTSYRNLRTRDLRDDNQAVKVIEDEFQHKFIVDVQDFMKDGEINVKAVDDQELVVEGHVEKQEGASKSIQRFSRRFTLPKDVHLESVSSVMSSDGVLTIIAPKKNAIGHMKESHTSENARKFVHDSEVSEKMSECNIKSSMQDIKCSHSGYEDKSIRASSTCSSVCDNTLQEGGDMAHQSSVASNAFKAESSKEAHVTGGHNVAIVVESSESKVKENDVQDLEHKSNREIPLDMEEARQMVREELYGEQRSKDMLDANQKSSRRSSIDEIDADIRRVREEILESREKRAGSVRFDEDFSTEDMDGNNINFQENSKHKEKTLRTILKTPERYLCENDERQSRERSLVAEDTQTEDRRTPSRDSRRRPSCTPLNPDTKRVLPISFRGHFCSDAFFYDYQESFKTAISDVLLKFNEKSATTDDITAYRNLRLRDPKLENQAFHVQEDEGAHRVVLDVKDFINGEIEAAIYEEKELVIQGRAERQHGTKYTILSFLRRFPLPENVDTDAITVVMSSDGVLVVVTPWKGHSGLSAIKNILSTEDMSFFDRHRDVDRRWDEADWEASKASEEFLNRSLDSRLRSRLRQATDDLFSRSERLNEGGETFLIMTTIQKTTTTKVTKTTTTETSCSSPQVTITKKGNFFNDSFFEDRRQDYQVAVRDVLSKFGDQTSKTDELQSYRDLRTRDLREENQAVRSTQDDRFHKIVIDVQDFTVGGEINVKTVDETKVVIEGQVQRTEGNSTSSKSFKKTFIFSDADMENITSVMSSDGVLTVTVPKKQQEMQQITNVERKVTKTLQQTQNTTDTSSTQQGDKRLCITQRGNFFDDSFFEDARRPFQEAVQQVLQKSNVTTSQSDQITTYRDLRQRELKDETQAATTSDDQSQHKIIVDVQDFINGGEVVVKTVDDREVVIEGSIKKQEGNKTSSKSFRKRYVLPDDIQTENVTSVVSADGVLTIIAPRKQRAIQPREANVPLAIQQTDNSKQVVASNTTNTAVQSVNQTNTQNQVASQQNITVQKKVTTVTQQSNVTTDGSTCSSPTDRSLPISKKGDFFNDSFFEDARKPFQEAVRDVLQKSNVTTTQTNEIQTYRDLRKRELKEETQAAITSDDQNQHKIIVDVQDFINGGEVTVKTVDEREVVIEGSIKKQEGNTTSSKSFRKRYVLPEDIQTERVTSVVSADGVLTIIAPKKPQPIMPGVVNVPLAIQQSDTNKQTMVSDTSNTASQSLNQTTSTQKQVVSQQTQQTQQTQQQNVTVQKKVTTVTQQSNVTTDQSSCSSPTDKSLTITKRGDFFNDSFFEDARRPFQEAIRNVLQKSNITSTQTNEIQSYRDLRQKELKEETQAATTSDDSNQHKIIVDVQDFINGGDVVVKTVDDREVVIEGSIKKQEGNKTSSKSFRKRYILPEDIQTENVTSVVSADGVLTIIAPKKQRAIQPRETNVPLAIQQTDNSKQVVASNTTNTAVQSVNQTNTQNQVASQQNITVQKKVTTVTQQSNVTTDGSTCSSPTDRSLPISKKGDFFNDSFFEDARKPFQEAVRDVLQKSNVTTTQTNEIQTYRDLRKRELKEETQAAITSDDQNQHKIIVDVQDFINGGEVTVKTVDEREVVIEGSIKKQEGNTTSSKSFRKRYVLPEDIQQRKVTSVVSADGVLTIIAPKKPQPIMPGVVNVPLAIQQSDTNKQTMVSDTSNTALQSLNQTTSTQKQAVSQQTQQTQQTQQQNVTVQKKVTTVTQQSNVTTDQSSCSSPTDKSLTITKRGDFFNDSFFEDARRPFQEAIRNVLQKSNITSTQTNEIQSYRDLRQKELKEETQAATTSDDSNQHKIIVDVQDFINGGDVVVKTVDDREVVIEGSIKKQEGNKTSSKSFRKRYILPEDIQTENVTSVVSADGVLTIIAPKKVTVVQQGREVVVPLSIQQKESSKKVMSSNTTDTQAVDQRSIDVASQQIQQNISVQKKVTRVTQQSHVTTEGGSTRSLTITKKGNFFNDDFFEDARTPFQDAIRSILEKSNVTTSQTNQIASYRDLRQRNLKEETQAATVSDDDKQHKIIVDVQDFINGGDVSVKTIDEREVVIEGTIKKQEGNKTSSKSFRKRYILPEDIDSEAVTSVVSADGVMTIIAPKKI
ncbi:LOW QUALITY PROTEIN: uncharacterized protein LOC135196549 [Macrobrachium nipponense]|uniref:LOW QUALITY PROTEIN: uncharacterized protein LOC135196549 n=1 Tax=Macrobrachium nipponense TaxID=159736 RepID=UPI0030C8A1AD